MIISGTGHRPQKLFTAEFYSHTNRVKLTKFLEQHLEKINPATVSNMLIARTKISLICGMIG
jgi:hypothetical protein